MQWVVFKVELDYTSTHFFELVPPPLSVTAAVSPWGLIKTVG